MPLGAAAPSCTRPSEICTGSGGAAERPIALLTTMRTLCIQQVPSPPVVQSLPAVDVGIEQEFDMRFSHTDPVSVES